MIHRDIRILIEDLNYTSAGLEDTNLHLVEYQIMNYKIKKMYDKSKQDDKNKINILDEISLFIDNTINFMNNSFDNYTKSMYRSCLAFKKEFKDFKLFLKNISLFIVFRFLLRSDKNIYIGYHINFFFKYNIFP